MVTLSMQKSSEATLLSMQVTTEDIQRAKDRLRVRNARTSKTPFSRLLLLFLLIGPGILVMLGENDGPSMLSYAATGATYGIGFFIPFIVLTFTMAFVVQELTVRLAAVTHRGHAELIFERFGSFWGWFSMIDLAIGNLLTLVVEFIAIQSGLGYFGVPTPIAVSIGLLLSITVMLSRRYWTWERIALVLSIFNCLFIPVAILVHPHWGQVGQALITWSPLPGKINQNLLLFIMSDIGATVTPWMLFFQQSALKDKGLTPKDIPHARIDTALGAFLAAAFGVAAIVATSVLFTHHVDASNFSSGAFAAAQFAQALEPYAGHIGATLFALAILEAGLLATITISSSTAYAFGEVTGAAHSLNRSVKEAKGFYAVMIACAAFAAAIVIIPHAPLTLIVLVVNVIATLAMPPALIFLILLVNDRKLMGDYVNGRIANIFAIGVTVFLVLAGSIWGIMTILTGLGILPNS
ncbi:MAG TPA: NRAMP family divalent metal transporter [Patescibacteria group bacterium]|nr:NRAMP family divalent metal transporter [Patescibacteria group bacterium]